MAAIEKQRLIFHCDCNNFFASCECLDHPELKDVPLAVAGDPKNRVGVKGRVRIMPRQDGTPEKECSP